MSKMTQLSYDIEQLYIDGLSARSIAVQLECPVETVLAAIESMGVEDSDSEQSSRVFAHMVQQLSPFENINS
jgi:hypothetical protein